METKSVTRLPTPTQYFFYFLSILIIFFIVHLTRDRIISFFHFSEKSDYLLYYIPSLKGFWFFVSIAVISIPLIQNIQEVLRSSDRKELFKTVGIATVTLLLLGLLAFRTGSWDMGLYYSKVTLNPFMQDAGWLNTRLLMPALAHILFFRGPWLYYYFTMLLTIVFISLLYSWNKDHIGLSAWQVVCLCTSSFVIFQYQIGGYPDILVFIFFILIMRDDFNQSAKLSLFLLALVAYESSIVIGIVLAWRYLKRREFLMYVLSILAYLLIWFALSGFNLSSITASHNVDGVSGIDWLLREPLKELIGIVVAYKVLWLLIAYAIFLTVSQKQYGDAIFILACIAGAVAMTIIALDTSRLMGFAFPAALHALTVIKKSASDKLLSRSAKIVFLMNLIVPSFYQGLNSGIRWSPGLYQMLYSWIPIWIKRFIA